MKDKIVKDGCVKIPDVKKENKDFLSDNFIPMDDLIKEEPDKYMAKFEGITRKGEEMTKNLIEALDNNKK